MLKGIGNFDQSEVRELGYAVAGTVTPGYSVHNHSINLFSVGYASPRLYKFLSMNYSVTGEILNRME